MSRSIWPSRRSCGLLAFALSLASVLAGVLSSTLAHASGVDPTRLSLPSGPGSIEGLGRTFSPSLASGTASYGVDIGVPPGAGGFGPHVSLDYDSGQGISDVGMGWRIGGIPSVRRSTEDGLPRFDASDVFELEGFGVPGPLVPVAGGYYRPQFEPGTFVRVQPAADLATWEVRSKGGTTYRFGSDVESEKGRVVTWLLRQAIDLHGHAVTYAWDTSSGHGVLQSITWNAYGADVQNVAAFAYEARPDPHTLYGGGIKQDFKQRLTTVTVTHGGSLVRRYDLTYSADVHSRLASVTLVGRDGTSREPTLAFTYSAPSFAAAGQVAAMATPPGRSPSDPNVELADLNGDSLPDLLVTLAGQYRSYVNQDGSSWQQGVDWSAAQSPSLALSTAGVQLADMDGDGAIDLVAKSGTDDFRYFPGATATSFGTPVQIATVPNFTFEDPDTQLADMDGDRRTDVILTTVDGIAIGYNENGSDWTIPSIIGPVDAAQPLRFSDGGHTQLCDLNGDRVEDFCYLTSGSLAWWPGRGRGVFDPAQSATGVPTWDPSSPWALHDLDGDGWADLVHVAGTQVDAALATAAGVFGPIRSVTGTPQVGPNTTVRYADMNGTGTVDIVWIDVADGPAQAWQYLELFPSGRAGLLTTIDNGLGHVTSITYGSAASDAAAARTSGNAWTSRINVAMLTVRSVRSDDGLGDPTVVTEYHYANGTYSPVERTFAGFAGGAETQDGDTYTPALLTENTFDVGLTDRTQRGLILTSQTEDATGYLFDATSTTYTTTSIDTAVDGVTPVTYTYKSAEQTTAIEGTTPSAGRTTLTEWTEDAFGDVTTESRWGEVVGGDKLAGNDEAITLRTYASDTADWLLGFVASEELQDGRGTRIALKRIYYDGADFVGLPLGQLTRGDASRQEAWVGPDANTFEPNIATRYDSDGNPLETKDARGGGHVFGWNPHDHTTLTSEGVKLDATVLTESAETDGAFGVLTSVTGYDGQTTAFQYDAFGRMTAIVRPGDSSAAPTTQYTYVEAAPLSRVITDARVWSGQNSFEHTEKLIDGLGRGRGELARDDGGQWALAGVALLDARGEARRTLRPRFVGQPEHDAPPLLVDAPGESAWRDAMARAVRTQTQAGIATRTSFAPFVLSTWDGAQNDPSSPYEHTPTVKGHDGLGRLVNLSQTLNGQLLVQTYAYDAAGALVARTDVEGNSSRYTYDGRGRRTSLNDPDLGSHLFFYDATSNLTAHQSPDGVISRFAFDIAGRPLSDDWEGDGQAEITRTYDKSARNPSDPLCAGKLVSITGPSGSTENEYDARERVTAIHYLIDGHRYDVQSVYDDRDREVLHQYPDGSSVRLRYNTRGRLTGYGTAVSIDYDADDRETRRSFNTGVATLDTFDADRRRVESRTTTSAGGVLQDLIWARDEASNIVSVSDSRPRVDSTHDRSESYGYDNLYRLTAAKGTWGAASWSYSPSGNLLSRTSATAALDGGAYSYGASHPHAPTMAAGRALTMDARGRVTDDGDRTLTWNAGDELVRVSASNGSLTESTFDGEGARRVRVERTTEGDTHTTYFLDSWSEVRDSKLVRYLVHDGKRFAQLSDANGAGGATGAAGILRRDDERSRLTPLAEVAPQISLSCVALALLAALLARARRTVRLGVPGLACVVLALSCGRHPDDGANLDGTVQLLGDEDELLFDDAIGTATEQTTGTGTSKTTFAAYPFGITRLDTSSLTRRFAGVPRDSGVGVDQMGARSYAPDLGIWLSADPLAIESPTTTVGRPFVSANPYAYADLSPAVATDRSGRLAGVDDLTALAFAGLAVASIAVYSVATSTSFRQNVTTAVNHASQAFDDIRERLRPTPASPPVVLPAPAPAPHVTLPPASPPLVPSTIPASSPHLNEAKPKQIVIDHNTSPEAARHVDDARRAAGKPLVGVVDRAGAADRRRDKLRGIPTAPGKDRDEVPPAVVDASGFPNSVRHIDSSDNRRAGSSMGQQLRGVPDQTVVEITTINGPPSSHPGFTPAL